MGQGALSGRRRLLRLGGLGGLASLGPLAAGALAGLSGCRPAPGASTAFTGGWVGASAERGHALRQAAGAGFTPPAGLAPRRASVLVLGGGIAGLACARALVRAGIDDLALLELEDGTGGNSRGHRLGGLDCPLGAHYLPLPGPQATEVQQLLFDLGLARTELGRTRYDERHLVHAPQERLWFQGAWHEGLLPPADDAPASRAQYRRFAVLVAQAQREVGFSLPTHRSRWTPAHAALDAQTFAAWLAGHGLDDARLRWYLDYCCLDDYGGDAATVSAWAGLHYFASRHGFRGGDEAAVVDDAGPDGVLTWPEGNAWLARRMAADVGAARLHTGRSVLRVDEGRHGVQVWAMEHGSGRVEAWSAPQVVLALPLMVAARVCSAPPAALQQAASTGRYAPWLVANLQLRGPLQARPGLGAAWDSVVYGRRSLGYVDAGHQSLRPDADAGPRVLTAYHALPPAQRAALLGQPWAVWAQRVVDDLAATHPDLPQQLQRVDLMRHGHAMRLPLPGARGDAALRALLAPQGRLHLAHADLSAYSVFEEAYGHGVRAAAAVRRALTG